MIRADSLGKVLEFVRAHSAKLVASLIIAGGFIWVFRRGGIPLVPGADVLGHVGPLAWPSAVATMVVASYLRTYRWIYLLRPVAPELPRWRVLGIGFVGFTAVVFAPLRAGEVARPYLMAQDGRITFAQGMASVGAERIIDGLFVTVLTGAGLLLTTPLSPLPDHLGTLPLPVTAVPGAVRFALALFVGAFVAMGFFFAARSLATRLVRRIVGPISARGADAIAAIVDRLADGLSFLRSWSASGPFLRDSVLYWLVMWGGYWFTLRACGADLSLTQTLVVMGVLGLGSLIPSGPGFFGAYQISAYCGMAMFLPESVVLGSGAAFVFITYVSQLGVTLLGLAFGSWLMAVTPKPPPLAPTTSEA